MEMNPGAQYSAEGMWDQAKLMIEGAEAGDGEEGTGARSKQMKIQRGRWKSGAFISFLRFGETQAPPSQFWQGVSYTV